MDENIESLQKGIRGLISDVNAHQEFIDSIFEILEKCFDKLKFLNKKCFELEREVSLLKDRVNGLEKAGESDVW
jgi:SMC interacting uncharacterized protein involved in chromosome segregation